MTAPRANHGPNQAQPASKTTPRPAPKPTAQTGDSAAMRAVVRAMQQQNMRKGRSGKDKTAPTANPERQRYMKLKKLAFAREGAPTSKVMMIRQKEGWFRFVGQSAVIFHYAIAPQIGYKSKLYEDKDYELPTAGGVVNIRDAELLCQMMAQHHFDIIKQEEDYCVFNAGKRYSLADLKAMMERKDKEWMSVNKMSLPFLSQPIFLPDISEIVFQFMLGLIRYP